MKFRTVIEPGISNDMISYDTPVLSVGSCFAEEIGSMFKKGKMDIMVNPFGVLYNPVSVADEIDIILKDREFGADDLANYGNRYLSFNHSTRFSDTDPIRSVKLINDVTREAHLFMKRADFLFITFGSARVYRLNESGAIVANCHKLPSSFFSRDILSIDSIVDIWCNTIDRLKEFNNKLKIWFTVSPVRHLKDGAHGNQVSKSLLILAIEELMKLRDGINYFPSYELLLDDLRDYRFYSDDMAHPGNNAVEYIWDYFMNTFFSSDTKKRVAEVSKIVSARAHRVAGSNEDDLEEFARSMVKKIEDFQGRHMNPDLGEELSYFYSLLKKN